MKPIQFNNNSKLPKEALIPRGWPDLDDEDDNDIILDDNCPNCGKEYDEIDYEYQICHLCKHVNNPQTTERK